jgi:cobalamin biosynthesis Mg chelatase CobN
VAALKNAVDRGQTLESAAQTLKNAGYSDAMIQEAQQAYASNPTGTPMQAAQAAAAPAGKKSSSGNKIPIIGIIVLLLLAAAAVGAYFFLF